MHALEVAWYISFMLSGGLIPNAFIVDHSLGWTEFDKRTQELELWMVMTYPEEQVNPDNPYSRPGMLYKAFKKDGKLYRAYANGTTVALNLVKPNRGPSTMITAAAKGFSDVLKSADGYSGPYRYPDKN